ncbi:MAG: S9 family peptidase [Bdellovibrio sp.]|nr:S9 family peptidase [Bdellovibrio sp.]
MKNVQAPVASKYPRKMTHHKDTIIDNYFWMRNKDHPETMPYLHAENKYFEAHMRPLQTLKNKLYKEMRSKIKEVDSSVPASDGPYLYFTRFKKGFQYSQHVRTAKDTGKEEVILDGNVLAKGKKYFSLSNLDIAPNDFSMVYGVDFDGSEKYTLHFKNLKTGKTSPTRIANSNGSVAWAKDSETLFYVVLDKSLRPYRVYRHTVGTDPKKDILVYEEKDPQQFISVDTSSSKEFIYIHSGGKITDEVWFLRSDDPKGTFKCVQPRIEGLEYQVQDRYNEFWIITNHKAKNFQLVKTSVNTPGLKNWKPVLKGSKDILRGSHLVLDAHIVINEKQNGLPQIRVYDIKKQKDHVVKFKDEAYAVGISGANFEFRTAVVRMDYSSPITPNSVFEYDLNARTFKTLKVKEVKGHKPANYVCKRVWALSHDKTKVPLTIVYKKGTKLNGSAAGYLYGYGSYGASIPDAFPASRDVFTLIDRGMVYALAHPRGGSEMGRHWYEDGKFLKKKNTFKDFIACADYLIQKKYVAPGRLAACGGSAGGMLMGACMNMRPELFTVVAAHVPFVDVLNTMFDKDLPLTQTEYKEWGNPEEKKYYHYMKSYSPYDNVEAKAYPHMFVTCGLNDPRVTYWEPAKWVAKLRELKTDNNTVIFKTNMGAGHFGKSGRFEHLWEQAEEYAFVMKILKVVKN